jgi:hypothetical protein
MTVFAYYQRHQRVNTVHPATPPAIRLRRKNWGVRYFSESNFRGGGGRTETSAEASGAAHPADVICNSVVWVIDSRRPQCLLTSRVFRRLGPQPGYFNLLEFGNPGIGRWVRGGGVCFVVISTGHHRASKLLLPMASSKFVFPNLKNSDIVLCMNELGVSFSEEDLQKPTPQRMQMVYEAFSDILMGYTRENFDSNVRACANEVENFVYSRNPLT